MNDMRSTVIPKSDQLNFDDFVGGQTKTIKITKISIGKHEQPVAMNYEGDNGKPWKPCKNMRRVIIHCWGDDANLYVGRRITLYGDPDVVFAGKKEGGIRISHISDINEPATIQIPERRGQRVLFTVRPLEISATMPHFESYLADIENAPTKEGLEYKFKQAYKLFTLSTDREKLTAAKDKRKQELTTTPENTNASIP